MSEIQKNAHHREGFETQDLSSAGVLYFMAGLAVLVILIYFIVAGMYRFLDSYDKGHQEPMNPMAVKTGVDPRTMNSDEIQKQVDKTFPQPVLEQSEQRQFGEFLEKQDRILASYDWVDPKGGVVRIPIDRAMELLAQRGLPVLPQGAAAQAPGSAKKETKAPPANKPAAPAR
jgi:hypothetical protein